MSEFKRENRYVVLKVKDIQDYGSAAQLDVLKGLLSDINTCRAGDGKRELKCVVIEDDWPEYEKVWAMIEARCSAGSAEGKQS
jgi:hypothetical protein